MKQLLILVSKEGKKKKKLVDYLNQALADRVKVTLGKLPDLTIEIEGKEVKVNLGERKITDFDLVYFRRSTLELLSLARTVAICLEFLDIDYIDSAMGKVGPWGDKLTSLTRLSLAGLPVIPSFFCWREKIEEYADYMISRFGLPLIAKEVTRQQGQGVFLLKQRDDFKFWRESEPEDQFLFQPFRPNEEEYRLLVLDNKVAVYERKIRQDPKEFRSNVALGAKEEFLNLKDCPKEMQEIAVKATKVLDFEIAGVDVLIDSQTGKKWLLEVNRGPGFTYDPKVSPELPALAAYFTSRLGLPAKER